MVRRRSRGTGTIGILWKRWPIRGRDAHELGPAEEGGDAWARMQFEAGMDLLGTVYLLGKCTVCARVIFSFPGGSLVTGVPANSQPFITTEHPTVYQMLFWVWGYC